MEQVVCPKCETQNTADSRFCKKCATPLPGLDEVLFTQTIETPADRLTPGTVFAKRYQIIEELGRGGMGRVYKARDTQIDETVAIKLIRSEIAEDAKVLERFSNELKLARKISHRNVCRMHQLEREGGTTFICMEYLEGEDLKDLIRRKGSLTEKEAVGIAAQVSEGLAEAHRQGIVHRDLKPQNIMIGESGLVKIMDFGIARSTEGTGVTKTGAIIGTPDYMSPEQADGAPADQRSDIYSLGVILYEMVTGEVPFRGETAFSVVMKHKSQLPPDPGKLKSELSGDLRRLILVCLEKDPKRRYQTAADLLADLGNIRDGLPLGTRIQPRRDTWLRRLVRRRWFIPATVVLGAAVVGLILWRVLPPRPSPADLSGLPSLAILPFENYTGEENLLRDVIPIVLTDKLNQSRFFTKVSAFQATRGAMQQLDLLKAEALTPENLKDIADSCEVNHLLSGQVAKIGARFMVTATIIDGRSGKTKAPLSYDAADFDEITAKLDSFSIEIKKALGIAEEQIENDIDLEIPEYYSRYPQARQLYLEGMALHIRGHWRESSEKMEKAVEIDPQFAMAYQVMAADYSNLGEGYSKFAAAQKKAKEFADRFPLKERLLILARSTVGKQKVDIAMQLLENYPDDVRVVCEVAMVYLWYFRWDQAIELLEIQLKKGSRYNPIINFLVFSYCADGQYDAALKICDEYDHKSSKIFVLICQGKYDQAIDAAEAILKSDPSSRFLGFHITYLGAALHLAGDFERAEEAYRRLLDFEVKADRSKGRDGLLALSISRGRFEEAKAIVKEYYERESSAYGLARIEYIKHNSEAAWKEYQRGFEWTEGKWIWNGFPALEVMLLLSNGRTAEAQALAEEFRERVEGYAKLNPFDYKNARLADYVQGIFDLEQGDYSSTIEHLKRAISLMPAQSEPFCQRSQSFSVDNSHAFYMWPLAEAYRRSGDLSKAQEQYEGITKLTTGRIEDGDLYAKSFYMLGKISEQRGWPGKAIDYYERFLEVWKDADSDIPELIDAKQRLEALKTGKS